MVVESNDRRTVVRRATTLLCVLVMTGCSAGGGATALEQVPVSDVPPHTSEDSDSSPVVDVPDGLEDLDIPTEETLDKDGATDDLLEVQAASDTADDATGFDVPPPWVYPLDDTLRLNHVQALGTHNSYHVQPQVPLHPDHKYTMPTLTDQLELWGVRQFEWDLHLHKDGSIEVFHIALIDQVSTCELFAQCLEETLAWSDAHPQHFPLVIWMELKDDIDTGILSDYVSFTDHLFEVESAILEVFSPDRVLTPDEVRGQHETLPQALASQGWPTLGALRGRVLFVFLEDGAHRDAYLSESPVLQNRLLFVDSDSPDQPFASFYKINNAQSEFETVQDLVSQGFIVTSNVDDVAGSLDDNAAKLAASLESGTHFLSTNWPVVTTDGAYYAHIPTGTPVRCNPVAAPEECSSEALENLSPEAP